MHGVYTFLLNLPTDADEKDLGAEALGEFEIYADHHCDENNWWEPLCLILQDGRLVHLAQKDDYRGRDEYAKGIVATIPQEQRWEWALNHATGTVGLELGAFDAKETYGLFEPGEGLKRLNEADRERIIAEIYFSVPPKLSKLYQEVLVETTDPLQHYRRKKLATVFEIFNASTFKPFSEDQMPPYHYPAFDLRDDPVDTIREGDALLLVDIHT